MIKKFFSKTTLVGFLSLFQMFYSQGKPNKEIIEEIGGECADWNNDAFYGSIINIDFNIDGKPLSIYLKPILTDSLKEKVRIPDLHITTSIISEADHKQRIFFLFSQVLQNKINPKFELFGDNSSFVLNLGDGFHITLFQGKGDIKKSIAPFESEINDSLNVSTITPKKIYDAFYSFIKEKYENNIQYKEAKKKYDKEKKNLEQKLQKEIKKQLKKDISNFKENKLDFNKLKKIIDEFKNKFSIDEDKHVVSLKLMQEIHKIPVKIEIDKINNLWKKLSNIINDKDDENDEKFSKIDEDITIIEDALKKSSIKDFKNAKEYFTDNKEFYDKICSVLDSPIENVYKDIVEKFNLEINNFIEKINHAKNDLRDYLRHLLSNVLETEESLKIDKTTQQKIMSLISNLNDSLKPENSDDEFIITES